MNLFLQCIKLEDPVFSPGFEMSIGVSHRKLARRGETESSLRGGIPSLMGQGGINWKYTEICFKFKQTYKSWPSAVHALVQL